MIMSERTLTERRKADRAMMAGTVAELARQYGLAVTVTGEQHGTRETSVALAGPHGLKVTVRFRGNLGGLAADTYVLNWHMQPWTDEGRDWQLAPHAFGNVNSYHGTKATDVVRGFTALADLLRYRFEAIADGSAFITAPQHPEQEEVNDHGNLVHNHLRRRSDRS